MTRWLRFGALSLFVLASVEASGQNGGIRGTVVDGNEQPLPGVSILLQFLDGVTRELRFESDENGSFVRLGVRMGNYLMTLEKDGFQPYTEQIRVPPGAPSRVGTLVLRSVTPGQPGDPINTEAREAFDRGLAELEIENYPAAMEAFEKVIELTPDSSDAHYNLGGVYRETGDDAKAMELFVKAAELDPRFYEAYVAMAELYSAERRWAETIEALKKAVEIRADSVEVLYSLGGAAMNATDMETAQEAFGKLLALDPAHAAGHYQMGMIFVNKGEKASAITHLEKYLELEPEGAQAATAKGILDYLKQN